MGPQPRITDQLRWEHFYIAARFHIKDLQLAIVIACHSEGKFVTNMDICTGNLQRKLQLATINIFLLLILRDNGLVDFLFFDFLLNRTNFVWFFSVNFFDRFNVNNLGFCFSVSIFVLGNMPSRERIQSCQSFLQIRELLLNFEAGNGCAPFQLQNFLHSQLLNRRIIDAQDGRLEFIRFQIKFCSKFFQIQIVFVEVGIPCDDLLVAGGDDTAGLAINGFFSRTNTLQCPNKLRLVAVVIGIHFFLLDIHRQQELRLIHIKPIGCFDVLAHAVQFGQNTISMTINTGTAIDDGRCLVLWSLLVRDDFLRAFIDPLAFIVRQIIPLQAIRQGENHLTAIMLKRFQTKRQRSIFFRPMGEFTKTLAAKTASKVIGFPVIATLRHVMTFDHPVVGGDAGCSTIECSAGNVAPFNVAININAKSLLQNPDIFRQVQQGMIDGRS